MAQLFFVYGTLKQGFGNNRLLKNSEFLGPATTADAAFYMNSMGAFPAVTEGDLRISGELYRVPEDDVQSLDWLEGHPRFYRREIQPVQCNGKLYDAWVYLIRGMEQKAGHQISLSNGIQEWMKPVRVFP